MPLTADRGSLQALALSARGRSRRRRRLPCPALPWGLAGGGARCPSDSQKSSELRAGPAEAARRTRPSWQPSAHAGAGSSARWGGWHCCSGCGCSRSPSGRRRSALRGQHRPHSPAGLSPSCPRGPHHLSSTGGAFSRHSAASALTMATSFWAPWVLGRVGTRPNPPPEATHAHTRQGCSSQVAAALAAGTAGAPSEST